MVIKFGKVKTILFAVIFITTVLFSQSVVEGEQTIPAQSGQVQTSQSQRVMSIQQHRAKILSSTYGSVPITDLIQLLTEIPGGPEIHQIFQVLAVRKNEVVPIVKEKLRTGRMWEKHMLTKLLRYSPWPEVHSELIDLARDTNEHWLPRQGALYALGELGNPSAGPEVLAILSEPNCPAGVQLVAISTLARLNHRKAVSTIKLFIKHQDVHIKLFAYRALAEFGNPVDRQFLLSALEDQSYIIRQEACGALVSIQGDEITQKLQSVAEQDFHEAVRATAKICLLDRQIRGRKPNEKLLILQNALEPVERRTAPWIIRTILNKCGVEGRVFVEQLSLRDDKIGERARALLIATEASLSTSFSDQENKTDSNREIKPLHAAAPTHQTLMEYAISKAGSLSTPLSFTSTQQTRMSQGAVDEDITWDILGESFRYLQHGYNPLTDSGFSIFTSARDRAYNIWNDRMEPYFEQGYLDAEETSTQWGGAWQQLGRVSHLLQDMSSPLHALATEWHVLGCEFEGFWANNDSTLRSTLNSIGSPLHSDDPLPSDATAKLDSFTQERLQYRYNNDCPQKDNDDVRGWVEVLAWTTYFRATFWGQVTFGTTGNGTSGPATSSQTTGTTFTDGYVGAKTNTLNTMFNGNVVYIDGWTDNYYEITDRLGHIFRWMSFTDVDDWSSCGRFWSSGYKDSSIRIGGSDDDDPGVRITGRFWFDTTQLGKDTSGNYNRRCYPNKYPNGDSMNDDLHLYYGKYGYPLTVRYNAGLLGLANRRTTVKTNYGQANGFTWGRKDNFSNGPTFNASTSNNYFYFVAKSSVDLTAPQTNTSGESFVRWDKDGASFSTNRTITINTSSSPIPNGGVVYTAVYNVPDTSPPTPNPMTWNTEPYETNISSISMIATTASDPTTPISYYFDYYANPTGGSGGTDSSWQSGTSYTNSGLSTNHQYGYRVKARDGSNNETSYSSPVSYDYTDIETPSGITFGTITSTSIQLKSTNTPSGLDRGSSGLYISSSTGQNSGWEKNNDYWTCSGLTPNYDTGFKIKARNGDGDQTNYCTTIWKYTLANKPGISSFSNITTDTIQVNWTSNGNYYYTEYYCENLTTGQNSGWVVNTYSWTNTELSSGTNYSFRVKARNSEAIETEWTTLGTQMTHYSPVISTIEPNSGPVGTYMKIEGQYFYDSGSVIFTGGATGEILQWSDTVIYCRVPNGAQGGDAVIYCPNAYSDPVGFSVTDPNIIHVDDDHTPNIENGALTYPFSKIERGIYSATTSDKVVVHQGTFYENINFNGKNIILTSLEPNDPNIVEVTIIDGGQNGSVVTFNSGEDANCVLTGFTITNGKGNFFPGPGGTEGGGVYCLGSSPTIINCTFIMNSADCGGGMCTRWGATPTLINCIFNGNAAVDGGGMHNDDASPTLINCTFRANSAENFGGGVYSYSQLFDPEVLTLTNCTFSGNWAGWYGGGMSHRSDFMVPPAMLTLTNCTFTGNSCYYGGGGIYMEDFYEETLSSLTLTNCTFMGNRADIAVGVLNFYSSLAMSNCIVWGSSETDPNQILSIGSLTTAITYSNVQGGWPGVGNIDVDPCFVESGYWDPNGTPEDVNDDFWVDGDYHLLPDSPCIDAGDPNYPEDANEFDMDGNARIIGGRIDIGADEYTFGELSDFNGDGIVNFKDFGILAYYWKDYVCEEPDWCEGCDYNQSGAVDANDLMRFAENWLWQAIWYSQ